MHNKILYECRNEYELLIACVLALQDTAPSLIYSNCAKDTIYKNLEIKSVDYGTTFFQKIKNYINFRKHSCKIVNIFHEISGLYDNKHAESINIIQHGAINYDAGFRLLRMGGVFYTLIKLIRMEPLAIGSGKRIKKIYLIKNVDIHRSIASKIEKLDLIKIFSSLSKPEIMWINALFSFDPSNMNNVDLLLTQPLSEYGLVDEPTKINIYAEVVESTPGLIIKPHPRELTDYKIHFPCNYTFEKSAPVELFNLNGIKLNKVFAINSSAINTVNCLEKVSIDVSRFPVLMSKL